MQPIYSKCGSVGFIDASAPIVVAGRHIANLLIGPCNFTGEVDEKLVREYGELIGADVEGMVGALDKVSTMSRERFEKVLALLGFIANEFSTIGYHKLGLELRVQERTSELYDANITLRKQLTEIRHKEKELHSYQEQLRSLAAKLSLAEEQERRNLACQLHDNISQSLAISKVRLGKILNTELPLHCVATLQQVFTSISDVINEIRSLTFELSPPIFYELGFIPAIESLLNDIQRQHGIVTSLEGKDISISSDDETGIVLYQAVRESLVNVVKHAEARSVTVSVRKLPGAVRIEVRDDGKGFNVSERNLRTITDQGFGLFSMFERIQHIGGMLVIDSKPGNGAGIIISVPMKTENGGTPWKPGMPIRILIADDHQVVRTGIRSMLSEESDFEFVGEASNGREVVEMADKLAPDLIIMDISMEEMNGIEATRLIIRKNPHIIVIACSIHQDPRFIAGIMKAGASGYLLKDDSISEFAHGIRAVLSGEKYFSASIRGKMIDGYLNSLLAGDASSLEDLSTREREILKLISEGKSSKYIADLLKISTRTVDIHRKNIMDKLNIFSVAELTKYAINMGLTSTEI